MDETEHFTFYAANSAEAAVPPLAHELEASYDRISSDLVPDRFDQVGGLAFSITLVEYLIEQYGFEVIIAIIKAPTEVEAILGITTSQLDSAWREYLLTFF